MNIHHVKRVDNNVRHTDDILMIQISRDNIKHDTKNKKMQQDLDDETEQPCTICLKAKPTSDYGKYNTWAFIE